MTVKQFPTGPIQRLQNLPIPRADVADFSNPVVLKLIQVATFGWSPSCSPSRAGQKINTAFGHVSQPHLIEHVAHCKARVEEHIETYIDGELPVWLRKPKYVLDVARVIQKMIQIVATYNYYRSLLVQEVALANAWAGECDALVGLAQATMTPAGLRTASEQALVPVLNRATADISQQIQENGSSTSCLI
ncbi:MAG TPA: hypothetical protein VJX67_10245 [Blastocatellia bacterium]|nr:hypothetical protein [Blastocatellia bacterium]